MKKLINKFLADESGATAIEYGLIAAAIGLMLVVVAPLVASQLNVTFRNIESGLVTANAKTW